MIENRQQRSACSPFIVAFFVLTPALLMSQHTPPLPQVIGKVSVFHLLDPLQPSMELALEHRFRENWYLHHQAAYLYRGYTELDIHRQTGFRWRSGVRRYLQPSIAYREKTFVEFSFSYLQSILELSDDFCRFDCAYIQRIKYKYNKNIYTLALDYGAANYLSQRFLLELAVSGGLRLGGNRYTNVPPDALLFNTSGFNPFRYDPNIEFIPIHFGLRLKLGYVLK